MSDSDVYVDSNVFLNVLLYSDSSKAVDARKVLGLIESAGIVAYTSTLTWDEVVWVVRRLMGNSDSTQAGKKLLSFPNLRFVPATEELLVRAQRLVEEYGIAPRDAIHCASAMSRDAKTIISDDPDFDAVSGLERKNPGTFIRSL